MRKKVVIRTDFVALHSWSDCEIEAVKFLRCPHRHKFFVELKFDVTDNNRELEFFVLQYKIKEILNKHFNDRDLENMSCEMMCEKLIELVKAEVDDSLSFVSVFEDNENGAEITIDRKE